ncbi:MAG: ABC transporter ATP-binding protein [Desulfobacteraceae bacterium]|nr:ABC transporter ATP-binding protein [Desulfobacteraceae bacterium]MBU4054055.1 ABC transporter ATP-binding protein [Pseudomonadota bacterium]
MKLVVRDICFSYNSHPVLSDIRFHLNPGQMMCILGVNGAGKSTLLKCLNRILKAGKGNVMVGEENLLSLGRKQIARIMGYVPQRHPETSLTVFEAVLLGRKPHIQWSVQQTDYLLVERILQEIGLAQLAMRPVSDLSGGEMQKVGIARALAQSPGILLLDEPTSNLDLKNQLDVMGLIRRIVDTQQLAAVVAIHDLNTALRFADRFVFMKNNSIHAAVPKEGLTSEIISEVYDVNVLLQDIGGHQVVVPV